MPTTIQSVPSLAMASRSSSIERHRFEMHFGIVIRLLWALIVLLTGAVAQFGAQSSEFDTLQLLAFS
jgi:hypothetical protein